MSEVKAFAAASAKSPLTAHTIHRRALTPNDVQIEILFCGVCHSDIHTAKGEWDGAKYPCVPGHEIVGRVTKVGSAVNKHKEGDTVAVGCMVSSDRTLPLLPPRPTSPTSYLSSFSSCSYSTPPRFLFLLLFFEHRRCRLHGLC